MLAAWTIINDQRSFRAIQIGHQREKIGLLSELVVKYPYLFLHGEEDLRWNPLQHFLKCCQVQ